MHDPVEVRRRIESLRERLACRGDYGELLANGHVVRWLDDVDSWRAGIRAQARADRIKVRTGADRCSGGVYALLVRRSDEDTGDDEYWAAHKKMVATSLALRHESAFGARHGPEILFYCERCPALGYAHAEDDVMGGSLLDAECPHGEEPRENCMRIMLG